MRLDPEDLRGAVHAYHRTVADLADKYRGFIARYMGDGVLLYFGYPQANEDDAERAVLAGLAILKAITSLGTAAGPPGTLMTRIGIASGVVIVGDLIGSGASLETAAVGQVPNLAARLQDVAEPNTVVIADSTRSLIRRPFKYRDLSSANLRGIGCIRFWAVSDDGALEAPSRTPSSKQIPLVGRDEQLTLLLHRWGQVGRGEGRVVLISGEPGIGKSRLVSELEQAIGCAPVRLICTPYEQDTFLQPFIRHLERAAGFEREDSLPAKQAKLETLLATANLTPSEIALFADLMSFVRPGLDPTTPLQRRKMTFMSINRYFANLAHLQPMLMVVEDIHWADPTTRELLDVQIQTIDQNPILLIVTTRSELQPSWGSQPQVTVQVLGGLQRLDARMLAKEVAGNSALAEEVIDRIIEQSEGIPLFIEELTKAVLESAAQRSGEDTPTVKKSFDVVIPTSLQAVLTARLDRLGDAKEIAQLSSVIGRDFSFELLLTLSGIAPPRLANALARIVGSGLVTARGEPPHSTYSFKHVLVQEAAYASLLRDRRRELHSRLAVIMEAGATAELAASPEQIAWHFAEAGVPDKSIMYYQKAAASATGRFALAEMVNYLKKALQQVPLLPHSQNKQRLELDLLVALGQALIDYRGSGSREVREAFQRARELCLATQDIPKLVLVFDGLVLNHHFGHAETDQILRYTGELLELAKDNPLALLCARRARSAVNLLHGHFEQARNEMQLVIDTYKNENLDSEYRKMARDPRVATYTLLGICLTALGRGAAGAEMSMQGLKHAETANHLASLNTALRRACVQATLQQDVSRVMVLSERLLLLNRKHETFVGSREGAIFQGWAQLCERWDALLSQRVQACLHELDTAKHWVMLPFLMLTIADVSGHHGDRDSSVSLINRALELIRVTGERWCEPEAFRLKACFAVPNVDEAVDLLRTSLAGAKEQGAKIWESRTGMCLAHMLRDMGQLSAAAEINRKHPD
jgi:class 3 adenylate cyclase